MIINVVEMSHQARLLTKTSFNENEFQQTIFHQKFHDYQRRRDEPSGASFNENGFLRKWILVKTLFVRGFAMWRRA
jgi:hypothetical protein